MIRLFLAGDVMLGRGIDQVLRFPGDPVLHEDYLKSALDYVRLAERASGPIPRGNDLAYVWGDASAVLQGANVDAGIINFETAVTDAGAPEPKGINYRMNPRNASGLRQLGIDCCVLANNHVLDWGPEGLAQTLHTLRGLSIASTGAGCNGREAAAPAILEHDRCRILVFGFATRDSGIPRQWSAGQDCPGVNLIDPSDERALDSIKMQVAAIKRKGDIAIASIHWGGNWGYDIPAGHVSFAQALIDDARIDIVHGHSSHHAKGWEVHHGKLILYGCGDFLNDYEGIRGQEEFRGDLALMYLPTLDESHDGQLASLTIVPFQIRNFRLNRASADDAEWLCTTLNSLCRSPGTQLSTNTDGVLRLQWDRDLADRAGD